MTPQPTRSSLQALHFEDLPADSETQGKGVHQGKRFRCALLEALDDQGREHRYRVRITRHLSPIEYHVMRMDAAERRWAELDEKDPERVKDHQRHCEKIRQASDQIEQHLLALREARRERAPAPADTITITDHGVTARQQQADRSQRCAENQGRASAAFIAHITADADVAPNDTQWAMIADFLEGVSDTKPFYFMGMAWLPVLEKAGAIVTTDSGDYQACGERFRAAYLSFEAAA